MTCNDCIHFDACRNLLEAFSPEYKGKKLTFTKACKHFKNKADFVEVVRCKSCVHYQNGACNHFGYYTYAPDVDEDDFCSYGERKVE